jgi:hypothetical protein
MKLDVLVDDHRLRYQLNKDVPALEWVFKPNYTFLSEEFRQAHRDFLEAYRQHVALFPQLRVLYDTSRAYVVPQEEATYAAAHITPHMVAAGLRREAFVVSQDIFLQMIVDDYRVLVKGDLQIGIFDDLAKARSWLALPMEAPYPGPAPA